MANKETLLLFFIIGGIDTRWLKVPSLPLRILTKAVSLSVLIVCCEEKMMKNIC
jgi:hypothetical protein